MSASTIPGAVREYRARHWEPVPLNGKDPSINGKGWQGRTYEDRDFERPGVNVGVLLGARSAGLVDIDLDCLAARKMAHYFLSPTKATFGRDKVGRSHLLYSTNTRLPVLRLIDPLRPKDEKAVIAEYRDGTREAAAQTMFPPSRHPDTGEMIRWYLNEEPSKVDAFDLLKRFKRLAAAALLAIYWPGEGARHDAINALAGGLSRVAYTEEEIQRFVDAISYATGDPQVRDRKNTAASTAHRTYADRATTGWPTLAKLLKNDGKTIVSTVCDWLELPGQGWKENGSTIESIGASSRLAAQEWPKPLAPEAFHGLVGDIVHALEPYSEADPVAHLAQLQVAFGNAVGRRPFFRVEDDWHFPNEFTALVGSTSKARKGTSWGSIRRMVGECDPTWEGRVMNGLSSGEGVVHQIRDSSGEGKDIDPGEPDKRLMIVEPELASVIATMGRQGNTLSPVLRQGWDGGHMGNLTKNTSETCVAPHISLIGHITVDELRRTLDRTELANGFANRFVFVCVRRSKLLPDGARLPDSLRQQLVGRLETAVDFARSVGEITRDNQAQELWREVYGPLSEGRSGLFGAIIARAEAHVVRLSCLCALLNLSPIVTLDHLEAALAFWKYSEDSAQYIFGDATGDPVADGILSALRNNPEGLTRTAISELFSRHQSKARIDVALSSLQTQGKAYRVQRTSEGRTADVWLYCFAKKAK